MYDEEYRQIMVLLRSIKAEMPEDKSGEIAAIKNSIDSLQKEIATLKKELLAALSNSDR